MSIPSVDITRQVIETLCKQSPEFKIFFNHHFSILEKQSLTPKYMKGKALFPKVTSLVPKQKTFEEKLRYYQEDINEWNKKHRFLPNTKIIITYTIEDLE